VLLCQYFLTFWSIVVLSSSGTSCLFWLLDGEGLKITNYILRHLGRLDGIFNSAVVWTSHLIVWTSHLVVWTSHLVVWTSHLIVWTSHLIVWTSHLVVWTSHLIVWTSHLVVWTSHLIVWTSHLIGDLELIYQVFVNLVTLYIGLSFCAESFVFQFAIKECKD
jgi:hypothetical protein